MTSWCQNMYNKQCSNIFLTSYFFLSVPSVFLLPFYSFCLSLSFKYVRSLFCLPLVRVCECQKVIFNGIYICPIETKHVPLARKKVIQCQPHCFARITLVCFCFCFFVLVFRVVAHTHTIGQTVKMLPMMLLSWGATLFIVCH